MHGMDALERRGVLSLSLASWAVAPEVEAARAFRLAPLAQPMAHAWHMEQKKRKRPAGIESATYCLENSASLKQRWSRARE